MLKSIMKQVNTLLTVGERTASVEALIDESNIFLDDEGNLEQVAYIEMVAQAAALFNGFRTRHRDDDPGGFLLGAKQFKFHESARAGDRLVINADKDMGFGGFSIVNGRVMRGETCMAEGQIKIYHVEGEA